MNTAILLSGGIGLRMGTDIPKQYIRVSGKMLITYCLETLLTHPMVDAVRIVAEEEWREIILADIRGNGTDTKKICGFSAPGTERQSSVFHALEDLAFSAALRTPNVPLIRDTALTPNVAPAHDAVLIHDAARPNVSKEQITACFEALRKHDGAMPVLPMKDTVYLSENGVHVSGLVDREKVFAGQAPEAFDFHKYYAANLRLMQDGLREIKGSTQPAVMAGMDIAMIPGDENNYKITTRADLERFRKQKEAELKETEVFRVDDR